MERSTKTKDNKGASTRKNAQEVRRDDNVVLTEAQQWELVDVADKIRAAGRLNTCQAFLLGAQLARAQAILPPKRFGRWLKEKCGYTTKWAKNYTNVHARLTPYKERMEKAAVAPTLMFVMATIEDVSRVETILDMIDRGERVTVEKARMMGALSEDRLHSLEPLEMPGRDGCRKIAEQRMKGNIATFYELLQSVLVEVENAVRKFAEGERVVKSELATAIEYPSRHAHDLFAITMAPYSVAPHAYLNWTPSSIDRSTPWGRFQKTIHLVGKKDQWPTHAKFKRWIVDEVHPLLRFAVLGEALPPATSHQETHFDQDGETSGVNPVADLQRVALDAPGLEPGNIASRKKPDRESDAAVGIEARFTESKRKKLEAQIAQIAPHLRPEIADEVTKELRAMIDDTDPKHFDRIVALAGIATTQNDSH